MYQKQDDSVWPEGGRIYTDNDRKCVSCGGTYAKNMWLNT